MRQHTTFNFSGGVALLVLAALSAPAMAQSTYSDTPTDPGEQQQFGQPGADQQAPSERQQGMDSDMTPGQPEMRMEKSESRERGARGPIRSEELSGNTAADRGYKGFLQFQESRTNSP